MLKFCWKKLKSLRKKLIALVRSMANLSNGMTQSISKACFYLITKFCFVFERMNKVSFSLSYLIFILVTVGMGFPDDRGLLCVLVDDGLNVFQNWKRPSRHVPGGRPRGHAAGNGFHDDLQQKRSTSAKFVTIYLKNKLSKN